MTETTQEGHPKISIVIEKQPPFQRPLPRDLVQLAEKEGLDLEHLCQFPELKEISRDLQQYRL
jgi:hypothetical protein